ncbi:L,D-transpeptidase [Flavobacterium sp. FBOR7N2.3]|uniref:L,D-transpeptidase n=1 Tax=Flavobacterium magnesitis TaxID=3138077 RepID=A0ABV4TMF2_9FLAO
MKPKLFILSALVCSVLLSCKENNKTVKEEKKEVKIERKKPNTITYHFEKTKSWLEKSANDSTQFQIVSAINRIDAQNLKKLDSIVVPNDTKGDIAHYLPFPLQVPYLEDISKIIYFSYPTQTFGAYEYGELVYTGPTNMGREKDKTPTGLFFTNWKAEETTSTFNDEWDLKWNFNIENKLGVGWHQYELPGYPASHSCLRLQESDAKKLYTWADEWVLQDDKNVKVKGTPVIVFGAYPFGQPKPWYQLVSSPNSLEISKSDIEKETQSHMNTILKEQKNRETVQGKK